MESGTACFAYSDASFCEFRDHRPTCSLPCTGARPRLSHDLFGTMCVVHVYPRLCLDGDSRGFEQMCIENEQPWYPPYVFTHSQWKLGLAGFHTLLFRFAFKHIPRRQ
ncbi:unnamed protein product, partial [Ectocarpus sp. 8 AP-2014]